LNANSVFLPAIGHRKEAPQTAVESIFPRESVARLTRPRRQRMPSFASIALPTATRLGASLAAGMSMFNENAAILPFRSTHPVHHPRFGVLENRHPVLP